MRNQVRRVETLKGEGTATARDGRSRSVSYSLTLYEHMVRTKTELPPNVMLRAGYREAFGRMSPACFFNEWGVTLTTADGQKFLIEQMDLLGLVNCRPQE